MHLGKDENDWDTGKLCTLAKFLIDSFRDVGESKLDAATKRQLLDDIEFIR